MKIRIKKLRFDSSKSTLPEDRCTTGPASGIFARTRDDGETIHSQTSSNYLFSRTFRTLASSTIPKIFASSFNSCHQDHVGLWVGSANYIPFQRSRFLLSPEQRDVSLKS